jgi:hypothetical protein
VYKTRFPPAYPPKYGRPWVLGASTRGLCPTPRLLNVAYRSHPELGIAQKLVIGATSWCYKQRLFDPLPSAPALDPFFLNPNTLQMFRINQFNDHHLNLLFGGGCPWFSQNAHPRALPPP